MRPSYLDLGLAELRARTLMAVEGLRECRVCPRGCGVNRLEDRWSACKTGRHAVVSSWFPHFGEEHCLRGWNGSGTIFFGHCSLRCVYCQNWDVSQGQRPGAATPGVTPAGIGRMMLDLQERGCHNINLVSPEHVVPQILEALVHAVERGLNIPLVYNTSGYDTGETLELLDGIVDIYMPDFKCWSPERAKRYLKAEDYPQVARSAIRTMHRQVGDLTISPDGLATRGLLVRHLVLPDQPEETRAVVRWIAAELGDGTYLNLMDQYRPAGRVSQSRYSELARRLEGHEFRAAVAMAEAVGLGRLDHVAHRPGTLSRR